jgi:penicillin-binding protein 1A
MASTLINDQPLDLPPSATGGQAWNPKNYDGRFDGPITMRQALERSKNLVSIRILQAIGTQYAQDFVTRFGFDAERHPAYLTMALGAGSVTPMQMASGFAVFANGGYRINPYLITRVTDASGKILAGSPPADPTPAGAAIDPRNAFLMGTMLNDVARIGTAARAQGTLKRPDLYGKTGTTNDALDAWFTGFQPTLVASVWMGYDTPRSLGSRETGGGLSLPVWISFMQTALKGVPGAEGMKPPQGVTRMGSDWFYDENARGGGISHLDGAGLDSVDTPENTPAATPPEGHTNVPVPRSPAPSTERNRILDMFN